MKAIARVARVTGAAILLLALSARPGHAAANGAAYASLPEQDRALLDDVERRTFAFFVDSANAANGQVPDHWPDDHGGDYFSSIASVGFGLTAYGIGVERGWMKRADAARRTLATLRFFHDAPQGEQPDATGYRGFYYHFLDMRTGRRYRSAKWVELSTIDTTLLLGGVLFAQSYYDRETRDEREIRRLAEAIYARVDWNWASPRAPAVAMGWTPEAGFIHADWRGYNEAMLLYVLALGSPTHAVDTAAWSEWTSNYDHTWGTFQGQRHLGFAPLFGHQYSHVWIDFRGIRDEYMRAHDLDYFENSKRATLAQREYAIHNPLQWKDYGKNLWGLTACNGPRKDIRIGEIDRYANDPKTFYGYIARGAGLLGTIDDGTIAPTAAASSIAFAPEIAIPAIREMRDRYGGALYTRHGFVDAFNPSFDYTDRPLRTGRVLPGVGWVDTLYLGIDQGPIVAMIENYRSGLVWDVMRRNPHVRRGLERAGFIGGWLAQPAPRTRSGAPE
ncbi:MAG TPA: glucoamylase family protein [Dokdonella sp.]|nr:glucoamylase family protein [Dokdonella sp.]